jgi:ATP/maltotriose-dependent transcriptional regulator MalT
VLVVAPSGLGKTSLLEQWATTTDAQDAWLSCGETDGELAQFWSRLTTQPRCAAVAQKAPRETPVHSAAG